MGRSLANSSIRRRNHETAIAGPHSPRLTSCIKQSVCLIVEKVGRPRRIPGAMDAPRRFAGADGLSVWMKWFENSIHGSEDIGFGARQLEDFALAARSRCHFRRQKSEMDQDVANATTTDRQRIDRYGAAAGHFRSDRDEPGTAGRGGGSARLTEIADHDG